MPSLGDSAVIIFLGLLLFGPKGLAQIARQLGKLMGEFRRASNEFRMQMEEELRISEQADRQKQIAAIEAAAPPAPALPASEPDEILDNHPHMPPVRSIAPQSEEAASLLPDPAATIDAVPAVVPVPIATSGSLNIMPPATGLPAPRSSSLSSFIEAVPRVDPPSSNGSHHEADITAPAPEESLHG